MSLITDMAFLDAEKQFQDEMEGHDEVRLAADPSKLIAKKRAIRRKKVKIAMKRKPTHHDDHVDSFFYANDYKNDFLKTLGKKAARRNKI